MKWPTVVPHTNILGLSYMRFTFNSTIFRIAFNFCQTKLIDDYNFSFFNKTFAVLSTFCACFVIKLFKYTQTSCVMKR